MLSMNCIKTLEIFIFFLKRNYIYKEMTACSFCSWVYFTKEPPERQ